MALISICRYSVRHPKRIVGLAILCTVAVAPGLTRLRLRTDANALLPSHTPEIQFDRAVREAFGIKDQIVVLLQSDHPDGIFNIHTLDVVRKLTRQIGDLDELEPSDLTSLATERDDRVMQGTMQFRTFLDPPPRTPQDLQRVREDLRAFQIFTGTLVSYDQSATCILVGVADGVDRPRLYRNIGRIIAGLGHIPESVSVVGPPVAESLLGTHILEDLGVPTALIEPHWTRPGVTEPLHFPRSLNELRRWIGRRIGLLPIALAVMLAVFLVTFKSLTASLLPLSEVGACLIFVFSLMGWCDVPVYLTIAVLPIILTAIGIADEIHIFIRYRQILCAQPDSKHTVLVENTMNEMWRPVVKTSITTAVGFMSFCLSPLDPVKAFGVFTAVGILFCMVWSLTVIPACLVLIPAGWFVSAKERESTARRPKTGTRWSGLAAAVLRYRVPVILLAVAAAAVAPSGIRRLSVQDSWIDGFSPDSEFYRASQTVNSKFHGSHLLVVAVDTGHLTIRGQAKEAALDSYELRLPAELVENPQGLVNQWIEIEPVDYAVQVPRAHRRRSGPLHRFAPIEMAELQGDDVVIRTKKSFGALRFGSRGTDEKRFRYEIRPCSMLQPATFRLLGGLQQFIEQKTAYAVGGVLGPRDYISTMNYTKNARQEEFRVVPDDSRKIRRLWNNYGANRGRHRLAQLVDQEYKRCLLTVFMKNANYRDTAKLIAEIRQYEERHLAAHGISLGFAGDVAASQALIGAIVRTQILSLLLSLLGVFVVATLFGRSLRWGIFCVLPCFLAVLINFAIMGWVGIPIGVATSMFAAMTLGIGVDFAIHLAERYRTVASAGMANRQAAIDAITTTAPAIVIDALAIALGFGILMLSQVPANARLGGLVVLSVMSCLVWTLFLLPSFMFLLTPGLRLSKQEDRA